MGGQEAAQLQRKSNMREAVFLGRRNKEYSKTLHQQAYDRLTGMQAFGESKREAKDTETDREKIFLTEDEMNRINALDRNEKHDWY